MNGLFGQISSGHLLPADFHFLRPDWLLALLPALVIAALVWKRMGTGQSAWVGLVDAHLLRHLALTDRSRAGRWPVFALLAAYALAILAMAGPAWQKLPTPALDRIDPTVVVLSLAQSMNATDQNPTRLAAARHKVEDILNRMRGGQVALIVFADAPFVAAPLTEDARVVQQMLPEIGTDLMPVMDNRPDIAIRQAIDLLKNTGAPTGRIILIGDGLGDRPEQTKATAASAGNAGYHVSVIGVGRDAPTPLVAFDGRPLTGRDRTPLTTRMDEAGLKDVAIAGRGVFTPLTVGDRDIDTILAQSGVDGPARPGELQDSGLVADQWADMGPFVLLVVVALFAPLAFRRGWIAILLLGLLAGATPLAPARAQEPSLSERWRDLWQTPDQQAAAAFKSQDYQGAAARFANPDWQASALYKAGDYEKAAEAYSRLPNGAYNQANALARAGKLDDAVKAYDEALKQNPDNADAIYNRNLVQKLIDDQKKMDLPQPPPQDQQNKDNKNGGGNQQDKQQQDKQDKGDNKQNTPQNQKDQKDQNKKDQGQQDQKDKKPDGDDEGKQKPDPKSGPQPQQAQPKPDPGQKNQPQQGQDQKDQSKPQPKDQGNDPAKADPKEGKDANKPDPKDGRDAPKPDQKDGKEAPKPDPRAPGNTPAQPQPAQPNPQGQPGQQPQPAQQAPQQAQPAQQGGDQPGMALAPFGLRPMTPEDQNREQALRMVPDDPMGLLRARIRAHYTGRPPEVEGVNQP